MRAYREMRKLLKPGGKESLFHSGGKFSSTVACHNMEIRAVSKDLSDVVKISGQC